MSFDAHVDPPLEVLTAKQEIRDWLARYCRAMDRMDEALARSVYHVGARFVYEGMFEGTGDEFVDWVWKMHAGMARHSHQINNALIEVGGDRAVSEAYVTAALWTQPDAEGRQSEVVVRGRYLDRWSRQKGGWAIDARTFLADTQSFTPIRTGAVAPSSTRDESDPSYALFSSL